MYMGQRIEDVMNLENHNCPCFIWGFAFSSGCEGKKRDKELAKVKFSYVAIIAY